MNKLEQFFQQERTNFTDLYAAAEGLSILRVFWDALGIHQRYIKCVVLVVSGTRNAIPPLNLPVCLLAHLPVAYGQN